MSVRLEDVTHGAQIGKLAERWIGADAIQLTYRTDDGRLDERLLYRDHELRLTLRQASGLHDSTADGALFKLDREALRILIAARFEPRLVVHSFDPEPLPGQVEAVYRSDLLNLTPLRFLLLNDPGAGKTIMARLCAEELMLRGDSVRCVIVALASLVEQWQEELADKFVLRFELLIRQLADVIIDCCTFARFPLMIARTDQLSRSDYLRDQLVRCDWNLVVFDEAHRMSADYFGSGVIDHKAVPAPAVPRPAHRGRIAAGVIRLPELPELPES